MKSNLMKNSNLKLYIPVRTLTDCIWSGDFDKLLPNQTYQLVLDYPLSDVAIFPIKTGKKGLNLISLLNHIGKSYEKVYKNEEKYGIWGHCMDDLVIEGIDINHKNKQIKLSVGS